MSDLHVSIQPDGTVVTQTAPEAETEAEPGGTGNHWVIINEPEA